MGHADIQTTMIYATWGKDRAADRRLWTRPLGPVRPRNTSPATWGRSPNRFKPGSKDRWTPYRFNRAELASRLFAALDAIRTDD